MRTIDDLESHWIATYTGKKFRPTKPKVEDVCIEDIAHALSLTCRFGGHCPVFYSVAQHSVFVSEHCTNALQGLLHDAAEAYICDLVNPVKREWRKRGIKEYDEVDAALTRCIFEKFGIQLVTTSSASTS